MRKPRQRIIALRFRRCRACVEAPASAVSCSTRPASSFLNRARLREQYLAVGRRIAGGGKRHGAGHAESRPNARSDLAGSRSAVSGFGELRLELVGSRRN